jgi:hypothetical protein
MCIYEKEIPNVWYGTGDGNSGSLRAKDARFIDLLTNLEQIGLANSILPLDGLIWLFKFLYYSNSLTTGGFSIVPEICSFRRLINCRMLISP